MKILFLTSGRHAPATRFRVLPYLRLLRQAGHRCVVRHSHPSKYEHYPWLGWRLSMRFRRWWRWLNLCEARLRRFDVVYIERELFDDDSAELEGRFRRAAPAFVLDIDDAVFLRHESKYAVLARLADRVIAGNEALADYTRPLNSELAVVPTSVDLQRYEPRPAPVKSGAPLVIGWTGTSSNLHHLKIVEEPLRRLAGEHAVELCIIADDDAPLQGMNFGDVRLRFIPWSPAREVSALQECHIGIMPLAEAPWERYKCGLKLIQYMALGLPAVASPVGVNARIVRSGVNGFLAESVDEWYHSLAALLGDAALRDRIGRAARTTVEEGYSVQANFPKLLAALTSVRRE
jgi:glycosyltransferase involved in cell wall biosynthesis